GNKTTSARGIAPSTVIKPPPEGNSSQQGLALRLVNSSSRCEGRVEIYYQGSWGTVCDDFWDLSDADVVCRQLGCGHGVAAKTSAFYGQGSGNIVLDNVGCRGWEYRLWDCPHSGLLSHNCGHHEDAGVICSGCNNTCVCQSNKQQHYCSQTGVPGSGAGTMCIVGVLRAIEKTVNPVYDGNHFKPGAAATRRAPLVPTTTPTWLPST
ncbi:unnamed protein product, partial [Lepidochelys olivacea]